MANKKKTTYQLEDFNYEKIKSFHLAAMVEEGTTGTVTTEDAALNGVGIAKYIKAGDRFEFKCNNITYIFSNSGKLISAASSGWELKLAVVVETVGDVGSVATGTNYGHATRSSGGNVSDDSIDTDTTRTLIINNLNARDQFAAEILNGIIRRMEADPTSLASSTRSYYCQVAYEWAANMMTAAANSRGKLIDETESDIVEQQPVGELDTNNEKLLNNLIYSLQRTDHVELNEGEEEYSERVINPKLNKIIEEFLANSDNENNPHDFEDLLDVLLNPQEDVDGSIHNRVKLHGWGDFMDALGEMTSKLVDIASAITDFTTAINTRLNNIEMDVADIKTSISDLATSTDVEDAKADIIDAMPSCKYTPPASNNEE